MLRFRSIAQTLTKIKGLASKLTTGDMYTSFYLILALFSGYFWGAFTEVRQERIPLQLERFEPIFPEPTLSVCEPISGPINAPGQAALLKREQVQSGVKKPLNEPNTGLYVGSKSGSKYHLPNCPGAQRISAENKVWFASKEDALAKGYTPAANCKGL